MTGVQFVLNPYNMNFDKIYNKRKRLHDALLENESGLLELVQDLYSDITHFIYEILQNAEDAKATTILFELSKEGLLIKHNGVPFSIGDIEGITNVAGKNNDKRSDQEKIGKFGIGFKSVYAITDIPKIQSGKYAFEIENYLLPVNFSENNDFDQTVILLPFSSSKDIQRTFRLITEKFQSFEPYNLLFLTHLHSITFRWDDNERIFRKQEQKFENSTIAFDTSVKVGKERFRYLLFKKSVKNERFSHLKNKPKITIAFKRTTKNEEEVFENAETGNIFAFFETGHETFLNFIVQAPFSTTPARDNIDFKLEVNQDLLDELGDLMVDIMEYHRDKKLITVNFLNQLPIDLDVNENKVVYHKFFETVRNEFRSDKKYLPTMFSNQYQAAKDLAIVRGRELTSIISSIGDLEMLFGVRYWMDTKITVDRTPDLREYLMMELEIEEYTPEDFARNITEEFLLTKKDNWIRRFYEFLNGKQESLWRSGGREKGVLRTKPIIRLDNNEQTYPFGEDGEPRVFLPIKSGKVNYDTVKPSIINSKGSLEFIKNKLGIHEPDIFDQVKQLIIPLYKKKKKPSKVEHARHVRLVLQVYDNLPENRKEELTSLFEDTEVDFFRAISSLTDKETYENYQEVYMPVQDLKQYFSFSPETKYVKQTFYQKIGPDMGCEFLRKCGIKDYPWKIHNEDPDLDDKKLLQLRENGGEKKITYQIGLSDYQLEGIPEFLDQQVILKQNSLLLWKIILTTIKKTDFDQDLFRGSYQWFYRYKYQTHFISSFLSLIEKKNWLYTNLDSSKPQKPGNIKLSELSPEYDKTSEEAQFLLKYLRFKTEVEQQLIDQLTPEKREAYAQFLAAVKLCEEKGIDLMTALNELASQAKKEEEEEELNNAPELNEVDLEEEDFQGFDDSKVEVDERNSENSGETGNQASHKVKNHSSSGMTQDMKNKIGDRGEKIVFKFLKKEWRKKAELVDESESEMQFKDGEGHLYNISLLNEEGKTGIGCDILIKNEETILEYIEVKSSKLSDKELFPVNGYQWALAQKTYKRGEGNKYYFYVVKDVLSHNPRVTQIKNPIKKWKEGLLRAHPVNLEL